MEKKNKEIFAAVKEKFGFVPNLFRTLSVSPAVSEVYLTTNLAMEGASLTAQERQAVNLAVSVRNGCKYCVAAHTAMCRMVDMKMSEIGLIKTGVLPEENGLAAVIRAARLIMEKKGWLDEEELTGLAAQGVGRAKIYEIIALIGIKTIANYVNHVAKTEIDPEFTAEA